MSNSAINAMFFAWIYLTSRISLAYDTTADLPAPVDPGSFWIGEAVEIAAEHNFYPETCGAMDPLPRPVLGWRTWWNFDSSAAGYYPVGVAFTYAIIDENTMQVVKESPLSQLAYRPYSYSGHWGSFNSPWMNVEVSTDSRINGYIAYMINLADKNQWRKIGTYAHSSGNSVLQNGVRVIYNHDTKNFLSFEVSREIFEHNGGEIFLTRPNPCLPVNTLGCYGIDGGGWRLVRHSYNKWHPASDNLMGTEEYGNFQNDPQSTTDFSIAFQPSDSTKFMFTDGTCSQYLVTTFSQFNEPRLDNPYLARILKSHIIDSAYNKHWYFREGNLEDPWISFDYHVPSNCLSCLYGENSRSNSYNSGRFVADPSLNVFIRSDNLDITFGFQVCETVNAGSISPVTVTFWWKKRMFECVVIPRRKGALYTCNSEASTTNKCITSTTTDEYAMQISNPNSNRVVTRVCVQSIYFKEGNSAFNVVDVGETIGLTVKYRNYSLVSPLPLRLTGTTRDAIPTCDTQLTNNGIYCPISNQDSMIWEYKDVGFNMFSSSEERAEDCVFRFSQRHSTYNSIGTEWIDPNKNLVIFSHGWQPTVFAYNDHYRPDKWSDITATACATGSNEGAEEPCPPTDHDARIWTRENWNVAMIDWAQWANTYKPWDAEEGLYQAVWEGETVIDILYELLVQLLRLTNWNGNELRLVGHSLGSQVVLNLASRIEQDLSHNFHVSRIALLDHYFSSYGKDYLGKHDSQCTDGCVPGAFVPTIVSMTVGNCWYCNRYWTGEYARDVLLKSIKESIKGSAVVETYRTSMIPSAANTYFLGDENRELDDKTIFTDLAPDMYGSDTGARHNAAFSIYLHCMKWVAHGQLHENAPSCRMDTAQLLAGCDIYTTGQRWDTPCNVRYVQTGGKTTTWDYDDTFDSTGSRHLLQATSYSENIYLPPDEIYEIQSIYSGKSFDCSGSNDIIQYEQMHNDNQKFYLVPLGDDYYTIKCYKNNKCVDRSISRNKLQQWSCHGGRNQKFKFVQQRGTYAIVDGYDKVIKAADNLIDLTASYNTDYKYDQLFSITHVQPDTIEPIPEYITEGGKCRSGSVTLTTQPHFENGVIVPDISFNGCKRQLFAYHIQNSAYIWAEYSNDDRRTCWIGQNRGYVGNGEAPSSCTRITTKCKLPILGNDHKWWPGQKVGMYFAFEKSRAQCIVGSFSGSVQRVYYSGTNTIENVKIWETDNVFASDYTIVIAHGRKNSGAQNGDWILGQWISFVDYPCDPQC